MPTGELVWEAGDIFKNDITTLREGELVQLEDDYVLEELQHALVSNYPTHLILEGNIIIGDGKLNVHHTKPVSEGGGDEPENLITLCTDCHAEVHKELREGKNLNDDI